MKKRTWRGAALSLALIALCSFARESAGGQTKDPLLVPKDAFMVETKTVRTSGYWWLRQGTSDNHTSQTVIGNLATGLENRSRTVNIRLYSDAGHGADQDPEDFIAWIGKIAGFTR